MSIAFYIGLIVGGIAGHIIGLVLFNFFLDNGALIVKKVKKFVYSIRPTVTIYLFPKHFRNLIKRFGEVINELPCYRRRLRSACPLMFSYYLDQIRETSGNLTMSPNLGLKRNICELIQESNKKFLSTIRGNEFMKDFMRREFRYYNRNLLMRAKPLWNQVMDKFIPPDYPLFVEYEDLCENSSKQGNTTPNKRSNQSLRHADTSSSSVVDPEANHG